MHNQLDILFGAFTHGERPLSMFHAFVVLLPIVIVVVVAWAIARARRDTRALVVMFGIFAAVALLSTFPRPGSNHLAGVAPLAFSATLGAFVFAIRSRPMSRQAHKVVVGLTSVVIAAALVVVAVHSVTGYTDPLVRRSGFAHLGGVPVPKRFATGVNDIRGFVREHTDGQVFILREDAGFWYLTTGTTNPLPVRRP